MLQSQTVPDAYFVQPVVRLKLLVPRDTGRRSWTRFGRIDQAHGFRRFLFRGVINARAEWAIICSAHNLLSS